MVRSLKRRDTGYGRLVAGIRKDIEAVKVVVERMRVVTYWRVGQRMARYLERKKGSGLASELARRLAKDLAIDVRTLQHCLQFFEVYPDFKAERPISWSHYRYLMSLDSATERRQWERRIVEEGFNCREFLALLQKSRQPAGRRRGTGKRLPVVKRGALYHYRLVKARDVHGARGQIMVDCGFAVSVEPPSTKARLVNKRIVRCVKAAGRYRLVLANVLTENIFTYRAFVERVVDGDTLVANIDVGFGIWIRQYLRLAGINAPELNSVAGQGARAAVEAQLQGCSFVVVKTRRSDKYDRYLADVFYAADTADPHAVAAKGIWLNQWLVDEGYAEVW